MTRAIQLSVQCCVGFPRQASADASLARALEILHLTQQLSILNALVHCFGDDVIVLSHVMAHTNASSGIVCEILDDAEVHRIVMRRRRKFVGGVVIFTFALLALCRWRRNAVLVIFIRSCGSVSKRRRVMRRIHFRRRSKLISSKVVCVRYFRLFLFLLLFLSSSRNRCCLCCLLLLKNFILFEQGETRARRMSLLTRVATRRVVDAIVVNAAAR